ncbi:MBL fold metallo-hydrolase [Halanaeroarchaeum sulfurireducens]|uniref:Metallo-beta-lactamase superfamily protein n=1 Tax=Halanaeroarchaeum sulfurireducens TaxID=1604004 RepID=A0A0F7P7Y7_9EURY|nr:MBL fold metallo-hydrolase [Halanaeroarchaeum sulfurireducens]AKH96832.1 metallo-beta-lactamase superfamily protein [Halanaeroarchaeum sulfurireducens]ALG81234.1 metallo-beta-lactamase superfamily protein [Halanaeroarchaeum sulfurireducens]
MASHEDVFIYDLPWSWGDVEEPLTVAVVETDEATVLVGTGDETTAADLLPVARENGVDVAIAEHGDGDHYGGIPALRDELDPTIAIPAADTGFLDEAGVPYDVELDPGATYWGVETIGVPGHTPGNMAFRYEDVLLAGDAVAGSDSAFAMEGEWPGALAPLGDAFNDDTERALESTSVLCEYDVETVVTAHGRNVHENADEEIDLLVDAIADRA